MSDDKESLNYDQQAMVNNKAFDYFKSIQQQCKEECEAYGGRILLTETRLLADVMARAWRQGYEARMKDEVRERAESGVDKDGH